MFLDGFITRARDGIAKRKRYNRLVSEINALSERDLTTYVPVVRKCSTKSTGSSTAEQPAPSRPQA